VYIINFKIKKQSFPFQKIKQAYSGIRYNNIFSIPYTYDIDFFPNYKHSSAGFVVVP
jgi:hypothetical protein